MITFMRNKDDFTFNMTSDEELVEYLNDHKMKSHQELVEDSIVEKLDKIAYHLEVISTILVQERTDRLVAEMMRDATSGELKSINDYIASISKPTGVDFNEEIPNND